MSIKIGNNVLAKSSTYHPDLFDVKWSDHILDNISWLRADTFSWHSGELYNKAYEHLLNEWNEVGDNPETEIIEGIQIWYRLAPDGHKICTKSQEDEIMQIYEATGVAWYYILDTDNHRFKLPRTKFAFTGVRNNVGKYVEAGLPQIDLTNESSVTAQGASYEAKSNKVQISSNGTGSGASSSGYANSAGIGYALDKSAIGSNVSEIIANNSIYGNSNTVQPQATEMYLYFYVGNFAQNDLTNVAGGIQDKATAVNYDNITNCITHIPQDIKIVYDASDPFRAILKAGSKVWFPDGFESDGTTRKFICKTVTVDLDISPTGGTGRCLCCARLDDNGDLTYCSSNGLNYAYSGDSSTTPVEYSMFYNTETNYAYRYDDTVSNYARCSLPICITEQTTGNQIASIERVFNGMGFVGNVFFVLPGVKGLMPHGKNNDGSLNNDIYEYTKVVIREHGSNSPTIVSLTAIPEKNGVPGAASDNVNTGYIYDADTNYFYTLDHAELTKENRRRLLLARVKFDTVASNKIRYTDIRPNYAFHAVNYSEFSAHKLIKYMLPNSSNNYTWYRLYNDGWVEQGGHINFTGSGYTTTVSFPIVMLTTNYTLTGGELSSSDGYGYHSHVVVGYDKTTTGFKSKIPDSGQGKDWLVMGIAKQ